MYCRASLHPTRTPARRTESTWNSWMIAKKYWFVRENIAQRQIPRLICQWFACDRVVWRWRFHLCWLRFISNLISSIFWTMLYSLRCSISTLVSQSEVESCGEEYRLWRNLLGEQKHLEEEQRRANEEKIMWNFNTENFSMRRFWIMSIPGLKKNSPWHS